MSYSYQKIAPFPEIKLPFLCSYWVHFVDYNLVWLGSFFGPLFLACSQPLDGYGLHCEGSTAVEAISRLWAVKEGQRQGDDPCPLDMRWACFECCVCVFIYGDFFVYLLIITQVYAFIFLSYVFVLLNTCS